MIRKWLNQQKIQRVIRAQQNLMRNTIIPDIDNKYQIKIAKLSNEKKKTVYSYAVHRNIKIGEKIQNYINQAQNRVNQTRRQIKPIRFRTQQTTRTENSVERSYNICPQHSIYLKNRKSVRTSSVIGAIKTQQSNSQLSFYKKSSIPKLITKRNTLFSQTRHSQQIEFIKYEKI
ncbi:unnamed protein product (macronuclear) [Paramecium tetraurelia]|uniref:Uncharacterized protein n=1 Tax=Paramecium tetraurelia TaxID=5888 RepID=A0DMG5_PARTE|nr:uncharacterized protein GSPATT00018450001 [Paramecium tetraurelia]CAK84232.1 unnamed protein product [Paramecium tetraurelia]|eukprot:XP_001451629.1 hypothetical protein (macronuclear) [Paramecium tetraurelia strain d4-2]